MDFYSRLSIKIKIILLVVFVSTIVSVVSIFTFYNFDKAEILKREIRDVSTISELIGQYTSVFVAFNNAENVNMVLNSIDSLNHITQIKVFKYDSSTGKHLNKPFGVMKKNNAENHNFVPFTQPLDTAWMTSKSLAVYKKIRNKDSGEIVGTIILISSLEFYEGQKRRVWIIALVMVLASIILATLLVLSLQGYISKPLLTLSEKIYTISKNKNYNIEKLQKSSKDEVQHLSFAFSRMLERIERDNKELITAKERALESVKAKDDFLAKMSHEIRTPLNAIMGLSNLLAQTELNHDQSFYVRSIRSSSENLLVIINEILDFSKIQAGKLEIEHAPFSLNNFLDNFISSIKIGIDAKELTLQLNKSEKLPNWLLGDSVRLGQVLLNLASNATKFTEKGEVTFDIELTQETEASSTIRFAISDTGIGIAKAKLQDIFGSFNQASTSTTRRYGGTGLGLTIAKELVELQGGNLQVESEEGFGSTFSFSITFENTESPNPSRTNEFDLQQLSDLLKLKKLKVLLVEDNSLNRILAKRILEKSEVTVYEALEGRDAIQQLRNNDIDLILMDLHMPGMDGYNTTQYIREKFNAPKNTTPIIALTAAATKGEVEKCFEYGMNEFVSKPINTEDLLRKIVSIF